MAVLTLQRVLDVLVHVRKQISPQADTLIKINVSATFRGSYIVLRFMAFSLTF